MEDLVLVQNSKLFKFLLNGKPMQVQASFRNRPRALPSPALNATLIFSLSAYGPSKKLNSLLLVGVENRLSFGTMMAGRDMDAEELNLVVLGLNGAGKSSITIQFITGHFLDEYDETIGERNQLIFCTFSDFSYFSEDLYRKQITVDEQNARLEILDTAGDLSEFAKERMRKTTTGIIAVYSITSRASFEQVAGLIEQAFQMREATNLPILIAGNKADLEKNRNVQSSEGQELANKYGAKFMEISARNKDQVNQCFFESVRSIRAANAKLKRREGGCGGPHPPIYPLPLIICCFCCLLRRSH
jgi:GTPase KRas protein